MKRFSGLALIAALATSAQAGAQANKTDYSRLPPSPAEELATLQKAVITLDQAILMAMKDLRADFPDDDPRCSAAWAERRGDHVYYVVQAFTGEAKHVVSVNAEQGVLDTRISRSGTQIPGAPIPADTELHTTESGLMFYDIKVGDGPQPAGPSSRVNVHYTGYLVDGKKFDSSVDRGQPITFRLNGVIAGWTEGVSSMKVGGRRKLIIPFDLAYGEKGRPPVIPPKAMLIFDVELLGLPDGQ